MNPPTHESTPTTHLSPKDQARIWWAAVRYDIWLDLRFVPKKRRKDLTLELRSNLVEASGRHGVGEALKRVGSLRALATAATPDDGRHVRWNAGGVLALTALALSGLTFVLLSMYYVEGVLDSGTTEPVSSGLFPFFGSRVAVDPPQSDGGPFSFEMEPGALPLLLAAATFAAVARPWRALRPDSSSRATSLDATL